MIPGIQRELAWRRMTRLWPAQLAKLPRVAVVDNRTLRRNLEYESIYSFDWNGNRLTESFRSPSALLHEEPYLLPTASVSDERFADLGPQVHDNPVT